MYTVDNNWGSRISVLGGRGLLDMLLHPVCDIPLIGHYIVNDLRNVREIPQPFELLTSWFGFFITAIDGGVTSEPECQSISSVGGILPVESIQTDDGEFIWEDFCGEITSSFECMHFILWDHISP